MSRLILILLLTTLSACHKDKVSNQYENVAKMNPITGSRIAWDYSSLQKLAPLPGNTYNYSSYSRIIKLDNGDYMCVYEADGNIDMIRSIDKGNSWYQPVRIASLKNNIVMAVPEIIQISNGNIIVAYNQRPQSPYSNDRNFAIVLKISKDNGYTWGNEKVVYTAHSTPNIGCWEPYILELATGELQLYFSNESVYPASNDQNISMMRSFNGGNTWSNIEIISYISGSRDGMPVALYLKESNEIIMSIEDPHNNNFKPAIIRTNNNWGNAPVGLGTDRVYALNHDTNNNVYQGAPYIKEAPSGNIILSYQGTDGERNNNITNARMLVEIGDKTGCNFSNGTKPFEIPAGKWGLWNSVSVIDNKIWALTSTNAYNTKQEVWAIEGYEIVDSYNIPYGEIVDSQNNVYPIFVGHKGQTNVGVRLGYNEINLFLKAKISDNAVVNKDGILFYLDPKNISSKYPASGIYCFSVTADGKFTVSEGYNKIWRGIDFTPKNISVSKNPNGYEIKLTLSWESIGGKPDTGKRIGFSVGLNDYTSENNLNYSEQLTLCEKDKPYTWISVILK